VIGLVTTAMTTTSESVTQSAGDDWQPVLVTAGVRLL